MVPCILSFAKNSFSLLLFPLGEALLSISASVICLRAALLGVGISHQALTKFAELLKLEAGSGPGNLTSKFSAAELRTETGGGEIIVRGRLIFSVKIIVWEYYSDPPSWMLEAGGCWN